MILAPLAVTVLLLCGCAASLAALPAGSVSLPLRVASVFALGYATVALTAVVLVLVHAMTTVVLAPVLVVVVVGMAAVAVRRSPVRATAAGLRAEVGADRLPLAAGAVVIAAIAVARMVVPVDAGAGGWRYWADGLEIAHAGHVPNVTLQWGILQAPAISKLGANSYNAALALALQSHPFSAMAASLWLSSIGFAVGLWALVWELGLRRISPVVPLVATAVYAWPFHIRLDGAIVGKLQFFQNEDAARMCAVIAVALALTAIRGETHGRLRPLVAGIIMAAAALTHLVPVLAMLALLVGYAVASIVRTRSAAIPARAAGTVLGTALLIPVVALAFAGGDLGFQGATGHSYQTLAGGFDPTLALLGRLEPPRPKADAHFYTQPGTIALNYVRSATALTGSHRSIAAPDPAVAALAAIAAVAGGTGERLTVAAAACMAGLLLAATMLFSFRYSYYIPATFGDRRLFEYGSIPLLLLGAAAGNALLNLLHGRALAAATVCVPVLAAVAVGWTGHGRRAPPRTPVAAVHPGRAPQDQLRQPPAHPVHESRLLPGAERPHQHPGGPDGVPAPRPARPRAAGRAAGAGVLQGSRGPRRPCSTRSISTTSSPTGDPGPCSIGYRVWNGPGRWPTSSSTASSIRRAAAGRTPRRWTATRAPRSR